MASTYDDTLVIVAGDFNSLNTNFVCDEFNPADGCNNYTWKHNYRQRYL